MPQFAYHHINMDVITGHENACHKSIHRLEYVFTTTQSIFQRFFSFKNYRSEGSERLIKLWWTDNDKTNAAHYARVITALYALFCNIRNINSLVISLKIFEKNATVLILLRRGRMGFKQKIVMRRAPQVLAQIHVVSNTPANFTRSSCNSVAAQAKTIYFGFSTFIPRFTVTSHMARERKWSAHTVNSTSQLSLHSNHR